MKRRLKQATRSTLPLMASYVGGALVFAGGWFPVIGVLVFFAAIVVQAILENILIAEVKAGRIGPWERGQ